jgi:anti-sigma factor RsiW
MTDFDANDRILRLNAALDGELDAMDSAELERAVHDDPALAAKYRRLAALREAVQRHAPREAAPQALADRIAALGAPVTLAATASPAAVRRLGWNTSSVMSLAASVAVLGFVAGAGLTALRLPSASNGVATGLVSDFARAEISGQPFDVASSDRHTVKPWLMSRATIAADIVDLAPQGFELAGGRIAIVDRVPAPTVVYRRREHMIAVTELPLGAAGMRGDGAIETMDGFHVARWSDANLSFVAVSDIDEKELAAFVEAFRRAGKPAGEGTRG